MDPFRPSRRLLLGALATSLPAAASAACGPEALGTARMLPVRTTGALRVGRKSYPQTLPLAPGEVVLTFDDGPHPGTTEPILDALARECVKATFFMIGRQAASYPALARRVLAAGHTVGHHSNTHPMTLAQLPQAAAEADIEAGFRAVDTALYGTYSGRPRTPFFRFPGFGDSAALNQGLAARDIGIFGADLWASDWNEMTPEHQLGLVMRRLAQSRGGILLFHDTRPQTAAMLPTFLHAMKAGGYRVVHIVPA
jgi:peptidoglycan/xylan/chitin deacetylase (PgdA/CDA1 family)